MQQAPGASRAEWAHWSLVLGLTADLLPVVSRIGAPIAPTSTLKSTGKTPSKYNQNGQVVGIAAWTAIHATDAQLDLWSKNHDYGICLQTRSVRAIDIDVDDLALAARIRARVAALLGVRLPARGRAGSGRVVLACEVAGPVAKRVVRIAADAARKSNAVGLLERRQSDIGGDKHLAGGAVELLGDGQQFIVAGTHPSGSRYFWEGGLPGEIPVVGATRLAGVLDQLEQEFGSEILQVGRALPEHSGTLVPRHRHRVSSDGLQPVVGARDPLRDWLDIRGWTRPDARGSSTGRSGESLIWCPWADEHTGDSGETETVYYPAGTGGYESGHFKCLHAHCAHRSDADFLAAVGWHLSFLPEIEEIHDDDAYRSGRRTGPAAARAGTDGPVDRLVDGAAGGPGRRNGVPVGRTGHAELAGGRGLGAAGGAVRGAGARLLGAEPVVAPQRLALAGAQGEPAGVVEAAPLSGGIEDWPTSWPDDPTEAWVSARPGEGLARDRKGWLATVKNVAQACRTPGWWRRLGYDTFRDEIMWSEWAGPMRGQWQRFTDEDYTRVRIQLERDGFAPVGRELVRDAVQLVAQEQQFDSAQIWLNRLRWDGVPRIDTFLSTYCSVPDTEYSRAVATYLWTALAGRVLVPGVQADMVPILVGAGGLRKSSLIRAIAPQPEFAVRVHLNMRDDDLARRLRGRLVAEVAELRGLHTRDSEDIKDWVSATEDTWTPKYKEFSHRGLRRFVLVGTTDKKEFLADEAGNFRRWLPVDVGGEIDTDSVILDCEQLWAEAADRFLLEGVAWERAQTLARQQHADYVLDDSWEEMLAAWLETSAAEDLSTACEQEDGGAQDTSWARVGFTSREALVYGVGLAPTSIGRTQEMKVGKVLRALGMEKKRGNRKAGAKSLRTWHRLEE